MSRVTSLLRQSSYFCYSVRVGSLVSDIRKIGNFGGRFLLALLYFMLVYTTTRSLHRCISDSYLSQDINRGVQSRFIRRAGHVVRTGKKEASQRFRAGNLKERAALKT